jgi:Lrp/AsnC family leucine-responsive transcriptional regulator
MFDEIDRQILSIVQGSARTNNAEIARLVGMAPSAVLRSCSTSDSRKDR